MNITFCIPTYNRYNLLKRTIDSILALDFEFNVIISDNCSNDYTEEYCLNLALSRNCIKYYRQATNIGSINNFIFLINKCKTSYTVIIADDDYLLSHNFSNYYSLIKNLNYDFFAAKSMRLDVSGNLKVNLPQGSYATGYYDASIAQDIIVSDLFMWSSCVFNTELIKEAVNDLNLISYDNKYREAIDVAILYTFSKKFGFYFVNQCVQIFSDHNVQSSKPNNEKSFMNLFSNRVNCFEILDNGKSNFFKNLYILDLLLKSKIYKYKNSYNFFLVQLDYKYLNIKRLIKYIFIKILPSKVLKLIFSR